MASLHVQLHQLGGYASPQGVSGGAFTVIAAQIPRSQAAEARQRATQFEESLLLNSLLARRFNKV